MFHLLYINTERVSVCVTVRHFSRAKSECVGDAMPVRGQSGQMGSNPGQILIDSRMGVTLGGWSYL